MAEPSGFSFQQRKSGDVVIFHHGRSAVTLRGPRAEKFLAAVRKGHDQHVMARFTGNYKRGNERQ